MIFVGFCYTDGSSSSDEPISNTPTTTTTVIPTTVTTTTQHNTLTTTITTFVSTAGTTMDSESNRSVTSSSLPYVHRDITDRNTSTSTNKISEMTQSIRFTRSQEVNETSVTYTTTPHMSDISQNQTTELKPQETAAGNLTTAKPTVITAGTQAKNGQHSPKNRSAPTYSDSEGNQTFTAVVQPHRSSTKANEPRWKIWMSAIPVGIVMCIIITCIVAKRR